MTRRLHIVLPLVAVLATAPAARGQAGDSTLVARFQLAESYLRAAQFDRAIGLLEDLVAMNPGAALFSDRLREAYESVKRYDDAIALLDRRLAGPEAKSVLLTEKARLQYLRGDEEEAFSTWDAAIRSDPGQPGAYLAVYRSMLPLRLFDRAIAVLEQGRGALGNDDLFRADLAHLYGLASRYDEAMVEYLAILNQSERQLAFVRGRLESVIESPQALDAAVRAVERGVRDNPLSRPVRELLGWLYMEADRYDLALDAYRVMDRLEQMQGRLLYGFALQATDAGAFEAAAAAHREILERYPDAPAAADAQAGLGALHERRASTPTDSTDAPSEYEAALLAYGRFVERYPGHPLQAEIRYRMARLRLDALFDLDRAQADLEDILARFPRDPAADRAAFDLGRLDILRGRLDEARLRFTRLADRLRTGELAEAARLELARLHYYRGQFDAARALVESMKENTSADVSNDAIALKVALVENRGPDSTDSALSAFARAALLERQRLPGVALGTLDSLLATLGDHALLDDIQFSRARLQAASNLPEQAVATWLELPLALPRSPLGDRSLFAAAEVQERVLGQPDAALATYVRLLDLYPGSLVAAEARVRIRRLRGDGA